MKMQIIEEEQLHFFLDHALEMVFAFRGNGEIIYANKIAKEQLEWGTELCNQRITDIFPQNFKEVGEGFETDCIFGGEKQELMAYRKNNTCFPVYVRLMKQEAEPAIYLCMAYNISEKVMLGKKLQQAQQEIEAAYKTKSEFVANITHELRTPVNGILGNTKELISMEKEEKKLGLLKLIEYSCKNMNALINNILDFAKLESGKFTLESRKFNLYHMIDYVKRNHRNKITEKGVEFLVTISPEVPEYIVGDELRIIQILNNLLSNACKFTSVGKIVLEVIKTAQYDNRVELFFMVIDSGIGISKANQDKLFKSFSQVDASITRKYGGTGLGLNICKQLVEMMDGNISVESKENVGSTFLFHIWVEVPKEEIGQIQDSQNKDEILQKLRGLTEKNTSEKIWKYGEEENLQELQKKMSKLILSIEMENWEKAEGFADIVRKLTEEAPKEIKTAALRLKMAVQKADYEKATATFEALQSLI